MGTRIPSDIILLGIVDNKVIPTKAIISGNFISHHRHGRPGINVFFDDDFEMTGGHAHIETNVGVCSINLKTKADLLKIHGLLLDRFLILSKKKIVTEIRFSSENPIPPTWHGVLEFVLPEIDAMSRVPEHTEAHVAALRSTPSLILDKNFDRAAMPARLFL